MLILAVLLYTPAIVLGNQDKMRELSFIENNMEETVSLEDEKLAAYFTTEDNLLIVDGIEAIPTTELMEGKAVTIDFSLYQNSFENDVKVLGLQDSQIEVVLSKDPIYWRLDTKDKTFGVGNNKIPAQNSFRSLLPESIKGIKAEFLLTLLQERTMKTQLVLHCMPEENIGASFTKIPTRSSLPAGLDLLRTGILQGEYIGKLELMANYDFTVPVVVQGKEQDKYSPVIRGKLTLVTWIDVYND